MSPRRTTPPPFSHAAIQPPSLTDADRHRLAAAWRRQSREVREIRGAEMAEAHFRGRSGTIHLDEYFGAHAPDPEITPPVEPVSCIPDNAPAPVITWGQPRPPGRLYQAIKGSLILLGLLAGLWLLATA